MGSRTTAAVRPPRHGRPPRRRTLVAARHAVRGDTESRHGQRRGGAGRGLLWGSGSECRVNVLASHPTRWETRFPNRAAPGGDGRRVEPQRGGDFGCIVLIGRQVGSSGWRWGHGSAPDHPGDCDNVAQRGERHVDGGGRAPPRHERPLVPSGELYRGAASVGQEHRRDLLGRDAAPRSESPERGRIAVRGGRVDVGVEIRGQVERGARPHGGARGGGSRGLGAQGPHDERRGDGGFVDEPERRGGGRHWGSLARVGVGRDAQELPFCGLSAYPTGGRAPRRDPLALARWRASRADRAA